MFVCHYKCKDPGRRQICTHGLFDMQRKVLLSYIISQIISRHFSLFRIHSGFSEAVEVKHKDRGKTMRALGLFFPLQG